jgi:hypothetical protein
MTDKQYKTMNEMVGMFFTNTKEFLKYLNNHDKYNVKHEWIHNNDVVK